MLYVAQRCDDAMNQFFCIFSQGGGRNEKISLTRGTDREGKKISLNEGEGKDFSQRGGRKEDFSQRKGRSKETVGFFE